MSETSSKGFWSFFNHHKSEKIASILKMVFILFEFHEFLLSVIDIPFVFKYSNSIKKVK